MEIDYAKLKELAPEISSELIGMASAVVVGQMITALIPAPVGLGMKIIVAIGRAGIGSAVVTAVAKAAAPDIRQILTGESQFIKNVDSKTI